MRPVVRRSGLRAARHESSTRVKVLGPMVCSTARTFGMRGSRVSLVQQYPHAATCSTTVTVRDTTPPEILNILAIPNVLWPPNHRMIPVSVTVDAVDTCDPSPVVLDEVIQRAEDLNYTRLRLDVRKRNRERREVDDWDPVEPGWAVTNSELGVDFVE